MVGSRHGWREAPYVRLPASPRDVAERLTAVEADGRRVVLAPGLSYADDVGADVMRGEETEIFGVADLAVAPPGQFGCVGSCCPPKKSAEFPKAG
jgi:2-dehydro-3-deoxygalactonokinase